MGIFQKGVFLSNKTGDEGPHIPSQKQKPQTSMLAIAVGSDLSPMGALPIMQSGSTDDLRARRGSRGIWGVQKRLRAEVFVGVMLQSAYVYLRAGTYFLRRGLPTVLCGGADLMGCDEHYF
jgi:hypothetical protein